MIPTKLDQTVRSKKALATWLDALPAETRALDFSNSELPTAAYGALLDWPGLDTLEALIVRSTKLKGKDLAPILERCAPTLVSLVLDSGALKKELLPTLTARPLPALRELSVRECSLKRADLEALLDSELFAELRRLSIDFNSLRKRDNDALLEATLDKELEQLRLDLAQASPKKIEAWFGAEARAAIREQHVGWDIATVPSLAAFGGLERLVLGKAEPSLLVEQVTSLELQAIELPPRRLERLESFTPSVGFNADEQQRAQVASWLAQQRPLRCVDLDGAPLDDGIIEALEPHLGGLEALRLPMRDTERFPAILAKCDALKLLAGDADVLAGQLPKGARLVADDETPLERLLA